MHKQILPLTRQGVHIMKNKHKFEVEQNGVFYLVSALRPNLNNKIEVGLEIY